MSNRTTRNALLVTVFAVFATGLAGCHLYLGDDDGDYCNDWSCSDTPPIDNPAGWSCTSNSNCAAGCFCNDDNYCEEFGFCETNDDCPSGFSCDDRSSCVPGAGGEPPPIERCTVDSECSDDLVCDTSRGICIPPYIDPPAASCQGSLNCSSAPPICPVGSTPAIQFGCYTGECIVNADCPDGAPLTCSDHAESACLEDATCGSVYRGVNCTADTGEECTSGSLDCTCESFVFDYCE